MAQRIGFIGLGIMGSRMAAHLRARNYELVVFNRTRDKAEPLLRAGATWGSSPKAVGADVDVLFTMLAHPEAVAAAALGADGFLSALRPGAIWVNSVTVNPSFARQMAEQAAARHVRYLDAPLTGSKRRRRPRRAVVHGRRRCGRPRICRPLLACMGTRIVHVGGLGLGSALKMVNNLLGALSMAAFAEGAALGQALGVSRQIIFDTLLGGPMVAPIISVKRAKIEHQDYDPDFALRWIQKDLHLASISAYEAGVAMPVANVAKEIYRLAMRHGYADQDFSALYAFLNESAAADRAASAHRLVRTAD